MALFDLTGKVAIVTGASRGIGLAIAEALATAGAHVVISSRKQEALDKVAAEMGERGVGVTAVAAHTGDPDAVQHLIQHTVDTHGGIDILFNNAATNPHFGPILTAEDSHWDKILDVNVKGYFRIAKACAPHMQARGGGKIINVASIAGKKAQPMMGVYSVSKAAVLMLTEVLAAELAPANIQVNAIAPGFVKTKFSAALWGNEQINTAVLRTIPQNRMADPSELTGIALYLASSASSFTTGATFLIDGGQMVGSGISF
ncbi:MAG: glucose 1-dehydrogenase [Ardenticatenaceae bacterium]|nr:glucose 1-dehydrogenase [Ardenticatenaceae bacterium]MCB8991651.1 glucose 1-dehydrogenase [Ardenticatenaceae bacterium]MCB9002749.1 glucose 1-dehydrogenase [Ardenticatenaceae bacterium]